MQKSLESRCLFYYQHFEKLFKKHSQKALPQLTTVSSLEM